MQIWWQMMTMLCWCLQYRGQLGKFCVNISAYSQNITLKLRRDLLCSSQTGSLATLHWIKSSGRKWWPGKIARKHCSKKQWEQFAKYVMLAHPLFCHYLKGFCWRFPDSDVDWVINRVSNFSHLCNANIEHLQDVNLIRNFDGTVFGIALLLTK